MNGVTTVYINKDVNVLYEKQTNGGSTTNDYVYDNGMLIGKMSSGSVYYFHSDNLGSIRRVTLGSSVSFSSNYQPFGSQYATSGTDPTYKYTGKPQDSATGLYYYSARYYDSTIGRFVTEDRNTGKLSSPQSLNRYAYVMNCPCSNTDPTGEYPIPIREDLFYGLNSGANWNPASIQLAPAPAVKASATPTVASQGFTGIAPGIDSIIHIATDVVTPVVVATAKIVTSAVTSYAKHEVDKAVALKDAVVSGAQSVAKTTADSLQKAGNWWSSLSDQERGCIVFGAWVAASALSFGVGFEISGTISATTQTGIFTATTALKVVPYAVAFLADLKALEAWDVAHNAAECLTPIIAHPLHPFSPQ